MKVAADQYVVLKKGETADPSKAQPYAKAAPAFLKGVEQDPDLQLHDLSTGLHYTANDAPAVKLACFSQIPASDLEVRSQDGAFRQAVQNLGDTLEELRQTKGGGIFCPKEGLWAVRPPESNPKYEEELEAFAGLAHLTAQTPPEEWPVPAAEETYPVRDYGNSSPELLPGLDGDKFLEVSVGFLQNSSQTKLAFLGATLGVAAYKGMGMKGVIALLMAALALQRYLKMGSKIIQDQKLDLVARAIQEGLPVNVHGQIDPEVMDALRHFPVGDHNLRFRQVSPAVQAREWNTRNLIRIDPGSFRLAETSETIQQIVDADTFVGEKGRYRLIGIDTPELNHDDPTKAEAGARKAWERLHKLIPAGSQVRVEVATNQPALYGRMPCYLYARDEQGKEFCVNQRLIEEGLARVTNFQPCHPKTQQFTQAALDAIAKRRGLWSAIYNPTPKPSIFSFKAIKDDKPMFDGREIMTVSLD